MYHITQIVHHTIVELLSELNTENMGHLPSGISLYSLLISGIEEAYKGVKGGDKWGSEEREDSSRVLSMIDEIKRNNSVSSNDVNSGRSSESSSFNSKSISNSNSDSKVIDENRNKQVDTATTKKTNLFDSSNNALTLLLSKISVNDIDALHTGGMTASKSYR